jgi:hypothetical protein
MAPQAPLRMAPQAPADMPTQAPVNMVKQAPVNRPPPHCSEYKELLLNSLLEAIRMLHEQARDALVDQFRRQGYWDENN